MEAPLDLAGSALQCPSCARLVDVPTVSELPNLDEDSLFKVAPEPRHDDSAEHIDELRRAFTPSHRDPSLKALDLRPTMVDVVRAGEVDDPGPGAPRYDPETGHLIEALPLAQPAPEPAIPMAKAAPLNYEQARPLALRGSLSLILELCRPINIFVMVLVFGAAAFLALLNSFLLILGVWPWFGIMLALLLLAHYGGVVVHTGPEEHEDLPRPLRGASFGEDIWFPLTRTLGALLLAYAPGILLWQLSVDRSELLIPALVLLAIGAVFFPAVLLTNLASGSFHNLAAARLVGVVLAAGFAYWLSVLLWALALTLHLWVIFGAWVVPARFRETRLFEAISDPAMALPQVVVALFVGHWAAWQLGLIHVRSHPHFGWAFQVHHRTLEARRAAELARAQRTASTPPHIAAVEGSAPLASVNSRREV